MYTFIYTCYTGLFYSNVALIKPLKLTVLLLNVTTKPVTWVIFFFTLIFIHNLKAELSFPLMNGLLGYKNIWKL